MEKGQMLQLIGFVTGCLKKIKTKGRDIENFFHTNQL